MTSAPPPLPDTPVTVYSSTTTGMPKLGRYLRDIRRHRSLIWNLSRSELKAEHYDTVLGQVWLVLNPLLMAAVYLLVRVVLRPVGNPETRNAIIDHLIMGVFFFLYTSGVVNAGARSIIGNKQMILNTSFPRAIFVIEIAVKGVVDFIPTFFVFLLMHWFLQQPFSAAFLVLPVIWALQTVLGFGAAALFATLTVYVRDTANFLRYCLRLWMFATPVLYTVSEIPPNLEPYLKWNPLYPYFAAYEQIGDGQWPSAGYVAAAAVWASAFLVVGVTIFLKRERYFGTKL